MLGRVRSRTRERRARRGSRVLDLSPPEEIVWRIRPLAAPHVLRHCPLCERTRAYAPSGDFRVNAQQRRLDVWLLYRCLACDDTWKRSVLRRVAPDAIAPERLAAFLRNDPAAAWQAALAPDPALQLVSAAEVVVERPPLVAGALRVRLTVPWPCGVRLDRLLAAELGCSRAEIMHRVGDGRLAIDPGGERALRRPPRDGTRILLRGPP